MSLPPSLIERFVRHLGEVRIEITALEAELASGGEDREPLRTTAHKLAGTAGAYGFETLGERAREVEQAVLADAPWEPTLAELVRAFRAALEEAAR